MTDIEIFLAAPDDPDELPAYLDQACGTATNLRQKVEALLAADRTRESPVDQIPADSVRHGPDAPVDPAGTRIGDYKLLHEIGRGGFGVVYMAEQLQPVKRRVALKIIKLGMDTRQVVARFEVERQALAMMDHPNIAKVLDAGATDDGRPYFVMELVRGIPVTEYCDENQLDTNERLELFAGVCRAVQHAHQKGVIHRDLKPTNVMVTMHDDKAVPKVIDFGVAKATQQDLTDKTLYTRYEQFIGTPAYMSPEQAQLSGLDIDTRSDVYSLGVLLYELLTGTTPFDSQQLAAAGQDEVRRVIREEEPPKPSTRVNTLGDLARTDLAKRHRLAPERLSSALRGDLDWIVMKALEKDRTRRYDTATGLAADIQRFLASEPVEAAAPSSYYRLRKYAKKHRATFATAGTIAALLVVGIVVSTALAINWKNAEAEASTALEAESNALDAKRQALQAAEQSERLTRLRLAEEWFESGQAPLAVAHLTKQLRKNPNDPVAAARLVSALSRRAFPQQTTAPLNYGNLENIGADLSADGSTVITQTRDAVLVWDTSTGNLRPLSARTKTPVAPAPGIERHTDLLKINRDLYELAHHDRSEVTSCTVNADGTLVAAGSNNGFAQVWDAHSGELLGSPRDQNPNRVGHTSFSHSGNFLVTKSSGKTFVWQITTSGDQPTAALDLDIGLNGQTDFSQDGKWLLVSRGMVHDYLGNRKPGAQTTLQVYNRQSGQPSPAVHLDSTVMDVALSPDASLMAAACQNGTIHVFDRQSRTPVCPAMRHADRVMHITFSPDGRLLASAAFDYTAQVWDTATGLPLGTPMRHPEGVWKVGFSPDGSRLFTLSYDRFVRFWDVGTGRLAGTPIPHSRKLVHIEFFPDGKRVLTSEWRGQTRICSPDPELPRSRVLTHPANVSFQKGGTSMDAARFSPDGKWIATFKDADSFVRLWDATSGELVRQIRHHTAGWNQGNISFEFSADSQHLQTWHKNKHDLLDHAIPEASDGVPVGTPGLIRDLLYSHDRTRALTTSPAPHASPSIDWREQPGQIQLWDTKPIGFSPIGKPITIETGIAAMAISHDHRTLAVASRNTVQLWDLQTRTELPPLTHPSKIVLLRFDPNRNRLAAASTAGTVRIWNLDHDLTTPLELRHGAPLIDAAFCPAADLDTLLTVSKETVQLYQLATAKRIGLPIKDVYHARFSPGGHRLATASEGWAAIIWDTATGLRLSEPLYHDEQIFDARFSPDGNQLISVGDRPTARIWDIPPVTLPVPAWFPTWAEAMVGTKLDSSDMAIEVPWHERRQILDHWREHARDHRDQYSTLARWSEQADPDKRTITPFSSLTAKQFVANEIRQNTLESLERALRYDPANPKIMRALATRLHESNLDPKSQAQLRASYYDRLTAQPAAEK